VSKGKSMNKTPRFCLMLTFLLSKHLTRFFKGLWQVSCLTKK
jgi:hypothetical protein